MEQDTPEYRLLMDRKRASDAGIMTAQVVEALKRLSLKPVRWVVLTSPRSEQSAGAFYFADQGAMLIGGAQLRAVSASLPNPGGKDTAVPGGGAGMYLPRWPAGRDRRSCATQLHRRLWPACE